MLVPKQIPRIRKGLLGTDIINLGTAPGDIQIGWDNTPEIIKDFAIKPIQVQKSGELVYIGPTLHEITNVTNNSNANYSFKIKLLGTRNLKIDMRIRRQNQNNFIALKIDFSTDTIKLISVLNGSEKLEDEYKRTFRYLGVHIYKFEIWALDNFIYGFINGYNAIRAFNDKLITEPGFSLNFPTVDLLDMPTIFGYHVAETFPQNPPSLINDPTDLFLQFRLSIKEEIENPKVKTWTSFQKALKLYEQRNVGTSDKIWTELGYPIKKPTAEKWFGD